MLELRRFELLRQGIRSQDGKHVFVIARSECPNTCFITARTWKISATVGGPSLGTLVWTGNCRWQSTDGEWDLKLCEDSSGQVVFHLYRTSDSKKYFNPGIGFNCVGVNGFTELSGTGGMVIEPLTYGDKRILMQALAKHTDEKTIYLHKRNAFSKPSVASALGLGRFRIVKVAKVITKALFAAVGWRPLTCQLAPCQCGPEHSNIWKFTLNGIGGMLETCTDYNTTWTLTRSNPPPFCTWFGSGPTGLQWTLDCSLGGQFFPDFFILQSGTTVAYRILASAWSPTGPNTLSIFSDDTSCAGWPPTITLTTT